MAYLAVDACYGLFQAIDACHSSPHSENKLIFAFLVHSCSSFRWGTTSIVSSPLGTPWRISLPPRAAYLAVKTCYGLFRVNDVCHDGSLLPFHQFGGSEYAVDKLIFDSYYLIFAERQQYEYRFCPHTSTPYCTEGGTGMSNCCDSPKHISDEHHLLTIPYATERNVEKSKYIPKARLITANKFTPNRAYFAINACHKLHVRGASQQQSCTITARKARSLLAADGRVENSLKNLLISFECVGDVPSRLARRFAEFAREARPLAPRSRLRLA
eukprot:3185717-Pleurochrysis_carterae.AAC.3